MILKNKINITILLAIVIFLSSCGIYSLSGANVEGKTIKFNFIDNKASIIAPQLSPTLTEKLRSKILNQTSLSPVNSGKYDYELGGTITNYDVGLSAISNTQQASQNKLTINVEINFVNNLDSKKSFKKTISKFAPFSANANLQSVEKQLIDLICADIADAVFNDAFVNW
jgi:Lipopolysaccharide-assembly